MTIQLDDDAIDPGESVNVTVIATYPTAIDWIEWEGVKAENENDNESSSSDPELSRKEHDCNGTTNCANVWSVKPTVPGEYHLRARARGEDGVTSEWVTTSLRVRTPDATSTPTQASQRHGSDFRTNVRTDVHADVNSDAIASRPVVATSALVLGPTGLRCQLGGAVKGAPHASRTERRPVAAQAVAPLTGSPSALGCSAHDETRISRVTRGPRLDLAPTPRSRSSSIGRKYAAVAHARLATHIVDSSVYERLPPR